MFPILPILILLFLGPANAERLAVEGRLPAAILAIHRAHSAPPRNAILAPVEKTEGAAEYHSASNPVRIVRHAVELPLRRESLSVNPACPSRAGPRVA